MSDGRWTGKDSAAASVRAAGRGVAVDYRPLRRPQANDTAIQSFLAPQSVLPGEGFVLSAWVESPVEQDIQYQLRRGDEILSFGTRRVATGLSRLMFRDRASSAGVNQYILTIAGAKNDPIPENNSARALVAVEGSGPVLVVCSAGENSGLVKLLRNGSVEVAGKTPKQCNWSLEELSQYSAARRTPSPLRAARLSINPRRLK